MVYPTLPQGSHFHCRYHPIPHHICLHFFYQLYPSHLLITTCPTLLSPRPPFPSPPLLFTITTIIITITITTITITIIISQWGPSLCLSCRQPHHQWCSHYTRSSTEHQWSLEIGVMVYPRRVLSLIIPQQRPCPHDTIVVSSPLVYIYLSTQYIPSLVVSRNVCCGYVFQTWFSTFFISWKQSENSQPINPP